MKTKWKVIASIMLLITAICFVFVMIVRQQHEEKVREIIAGKSESAALLADTILSVESSRYQKRISAFVNPGISLSREQMIRAFAQKDREKLLQLSTSLFTVLKKEDPYFRTIGWILPDNNVFLRVLYPEKYGDNVSTIRPDVAAVNRDRRQYSGFDVGIKSMQYRVVQPVFYKDEYIGAVQFGLDANMVIDALRNKLNTIAGMTILHEEWAGAKEAEFGASQGGLPLIRSLDAALFRPVKDTLDWNRQQQRIELDGSPYVVINVLPVTNYLDTKLGDFFVALDISEELVQKRKLLASTLLISSVLLLCSFLILYFSYGRLVQKIIDLNQSLEKNNLALEKRVQERTLKLQDSKQRLQRILNHAPLGILITDSQTMQFKYANPALCIMLGYGQDEMVSMGVDALHSPTDVDTISKVIKEKKDGQKNLATDIRFLKKDGMTFEADSISAPIELKGRSCVVSFIVDQTERKKLELELYRAQKMEAIGLMAGGVAHDLNNILTSITGYPELLLMQLPQGSSLRKPLAAIKDSGERAAAVVADLLTVARGVASVRRSVCLNSLIMEYVNSPECRHLVSFYPQVRFDQKLSDQLPVISCSPVHIKKCIMNLVQNAAEAIDNAGTITLSTFSRIPEQQWAADKGLQQVEYVVLMVTDTGAGIPPESIEHIFEPFFTKKVMGRSGTGLGLAVVWNTVKDHDGKIFVESSERGTTFQLYFPACNEGGKGTAESKAEEMINGNGEHILIVDDEPRLRDVAGQMLQSLGYTTSTVASGELAIEFLKRNRADLIVLDMLMEPGMSGRQTYQEIVKFYPDQKAILASGFSDSEDVKLTLELGARTFIKKPYSLEQLGRAVRDGLQR